MDIKKEFSNEIEILKKKFPKKDEEDIVDEIDNAINIFRSLKKDLTKSTFEDYERNWIKRCTIELLERGIKSINLSSYSENGYSESYFTDLISDNLRYEIIPKARGLKHVNDQSA